MVRAFALTLPLLVAQLAWAQGEPAASSSAPSAGSGTTSAPAAVPPTTPEQFEASRREYGDGAAAYERGEYDVALQHFRAAYQLAPSPELWFNIGRCHERLGRWVEAAKAYEQYLAGKPTVEDAIQIRERIADLRLRADATAQLAALTAAAHPPAPPPPPRNLRPAAWALLGVTVVLGGAGVGIYLSEWSDYQSRRAACGGGCAPESLDGLRTRVQAAEAAAAATWALAGAALVADVTLWIVDGRRRRDERRVVNASASGVEVRF